MSLIQISIIVPVFNASKYILDCLKSIDEQTRKDFEVIIINDGSTDNSKLIIESYINTRMSSIPIKLISTTNKGVSSARNIGITESSGNYISFVDADDILDNNFLEILISNLTTHKASLIFCREIKFKTNEEIKITIKKKPNYIGIYEKSNLSWLKLFLFRKIKPGIWVFLIERKLITSHNLLFREGLHYSEDIEFIYYLLHYSSKTIFLDQFLYYYRVHNNSAMSKFNIRRLKVIDVYNELDKFFKSNNKNFYKSFHTFAHSRILWSITWQFAAASQNYNVFFDFIRTRRLKFLRNLIYPNLLIILSSFLLIISPFLYYIFIRFVFLVKKSRKFTYEQK